MGMQIEPYDPRHLDAVIRLSLRAWTPVFDSIQKAMNADVYQAFYPHHWRVSQQTGMSVAMVETGGDADHERARRTYEKVGFELFPVARYFKKLGSADVKSQGLLGSRGAIALVPILHLGMIRLGSPPASGEAASER